MDWGFLATATGNGFELMAFCNLCKYTLFLVLRLLSLENASIPFAVFNRVLSYKGGDVYFFFAGHREQ